MHLPPELNFLSPILSEAKEEYRTARWLHNNFDDPVWRVSFEFKTLKELDWRVLLDDGSYLTESKHKQLLDSFKYYLTSCTRNTSSFLEETKGQRSQQKRFRAAGHIIDFLLINSKRYQLSSHGLGGLTNGNLIEILDTIASTPLTAESVYNWTNRLRKYCLDLVKLTDLNEISAVLKRRPEIGLITNEQLDDDTLGISYDLIPQVRASLYLRDFYHNQISYGKQPNTLLLAQDIYRDTLRGKSLGKPVHPILCFNKDTSTFKKEYRSAPVKSGQHEKMIESRYYSYRSSLYSLGLLHEIPLPCPSLEALMEAASYMPDLSTTGRFRTVPSDIVFKGIRQAIEFHLDNGQDITKAFCRVALECRKRNITPSDLTDDEVQNLAGKKLATLGVNRLCLSTPLRGLAPAKAFNNVKGEKHEYFKNLRSNSGLYELIMVYTGCIQLTVGVLMARRASELYELNAADCLDETESWLMFKNAKSTRHLFGHRRRQARPIEPIAADMIKTLARMQKVLQRIGYARNLKTLFAIPAVTGAAKFTESSALVYNRNLDMFCDYFETPLNTAGERYYFRQHQMRRFFAMLFFYCGSFAKLDTLQWMLGHADPKHVYHYITESTDGAILASAKAHYVAEQLHMGNVENYLALAELLKNRYGTEDFNLIDTHDLEDQIQDLVTEGWVEIEPDFFTDHQGKKFKIVARLIRTGGQNE
ncbi:TPA: integrase [Pseudomonas aeruginosa]